VPLAFHSGCEADHSPPSSAEVKEWVELTYTPPYASWRGAQLGGEQGQLLPLCSCFTLYKNSAFIEGAYFPVYYHPKFYDITLSGISVVTTSEVRMLMLIMVGN
jgi:hypothetical protein